MSEIRNKNFSKGHLTKLASMDIQNGDTFTNCNFTQTEVDTEILKGYTGLTFVKCNLVNCKIPEDAKAEKCLYIKIDFCSHLHPTKIKKVPCIEDCKHVKTKEVVTIDGQKVATIYQREDLKVVS